MYPHVDTKVRGIAQIMDFWSPAHPIKYAGIRIHLPTKGPLTTYSQPFMNNPYTIFVFFILLAIGSRAQAQSLPMQAATHFNQFQEAVGHKKLDSASYYANQLALENTDLLNFLLHDTFAHSFNTAANLLADTTFARQLLRKLYTGNQALQRSIYPLYQWQEIRASLNDSLKLNRLVAGFLVAQERTDETIGNRLDRYALLIYRTLKSNPKSAVLADTLFAHTYRRLEHAVNGFYYPQTDDRNQRSGRAYFRYLMAYANLVKANERLSQQNPTQAESYLQLASQFSPDDTDRMAHVAYFHEASFLQNGREDFHEDYARFLLDKGDTTQAVNVLTELTLADPGNLPLLKTYYQKIRFSSMPFQTYWTKKLNEKLKPAEPFRLTDLTNQVFNYETLRGKWILIDFWGTWCQPCVEELPRFQTFYSDLQKNGLSNVVVFTAASHDTEVRVREFMKKHGYTFPVIMADDAFIKQFRVGEYPTKVLITPQGNRMKIPPGTNWAERVTILSQN